MFKAGLLDFEQLGKSTQATVDKSCLKTILFSIANKLPQLPQL